MDVRDRMPAIDPRISIVMIFLDAAAFIDDAIRSVLAQDHPSWELILVDDGSTDGSTDIAQQHAGQHPGRIRYLEHPGHANLGIARSRNAGVAAARGGLLAFLDADDLWLPTTLRTLDGLLTEHPDAGFAMGASEWWYSWDPAAEQPDRVVHIGVAPGLHEPPVLAHRLYPLGRGNAPTVNSLLVRREQMEAVGGFEDRFTGMYEDQSLLLPLYLTTSAVVTDHVCDRYRQRGGSVNAAGRGEAYLAVRAAFMDWFHDEFAARHRLPWRVRLQLMRVVVPQRMPWLRRVKGVVGRAVRR